MIDEVQLKQIMPRLSTDKVNLYLEPLNQAMQEFNITTLVRIAAFLAQLAHESNQLEWLHELATGKEYEGRVDLGNTHPGDGIRYKGRGPIQLTGRGNYRAAGLALGLDLENNPEQAAETNVMFRTAGWFWKSRHLNELADQIAPADIAAFDYDDFDKITHRINGGYNGRAERNAYFNKSLKILGVI